MILSAGCVRSMASWNLAEVGWSMKMNELIAFFDASGTPNSGAILVVSGFISTAKRWKQFEREWAQLLREAKIPYFRMSEFNSHQGPFKAWRGKDNKRQAFLRRLLRIVVSHAAQSFAAGVVLADWQRCNTYYQLDEKDFSPFSLCAWTCIDRVREWCIKHDAELTRVRFVFEDGDSGKGQFISRSSRDFGINIEFGAKVPNSEISFFRPLQASDFAAWHVRKVMADQANGTLHGLRYDFEQLFARIPYESYHRHFSMRAGTPTIARPGEFGPLKRSLGISSLVRFCAEMSVPGRQNDKVERPE